MLDLLKLTVGIAIVTGLLFAVPIFAYIFGVGLALAVLYALIREFKEAENNVQNTPKS